MPLRIQGKRERGLVLPFRVVPDSLWEREPHFRGRPPRSELSKALLLGQVVEVTGMKNLGSLYSLAKRHGKKAKSQKTIVNDREVTLVRFIDPE